MAVVCGTSQRYIQDFSAGLYGKRYEGYFFDDFTYFNESNGEIAKPYSSIDAFVGSFDGRPYSWMWLGYFKAPTSGYYTFYIESNDSSWMWLGEGAFDKTNVETALIDNSGVRVFGLREKSATIYLRAGEMYPLRVLYGYLYDTDSMTLSFEGPSIAKTTDGTGYYFGGEYLFNASFGRSVQKTPENKRNDAFEFTIETTTANEQFLLPLTGVTSINVNWGDGTIETGITTNNPTHTYATAGTHAISVTGSATSVVFDGSGSESKLRTVTNLGALGWTNFQSAFADCTNFTSFECGDCDTSNVTSTRNMFIRSSSLTTLDIFELNTSSVTTMDRMFQGCSLVTALDVSKWNTSSVTRMYCLFLGCASVQALDVTGFDMSNVTNFGYMFGGCSSLTSIDVSGFDTSSTITMSYVFGGCSSLTSIDVSGFDTSNVVAFNEGGSGMFQGCSNLENLDISGWDVTSATSANGLLNNANNALTTLQYDKVLRNWSAQSLQSGVNIHFGDAQYTPGGSAEAAREVLVNTYGWIITDGGPVSNFNSAFEFTIETTTANESFFVPIRNITSIDIDWGDGTVDTGITADNPTHTYATAGTHAISVTGSATTLRFDFDANGSKLKTVTNLGALGWTNFFRAITSCENLTSFDPGDCDISGVTNMDAMFFQCGALTTLDLSAFDTSNVTRMSNMFRQCFNLTTLQISEFDMSKVTNISRMIENPSLLENLDISSWNVSSVTSASNFLFDANLALTTEQYEEVLINWASQPLQSDVLIHFGDAAVTPGSKGANARQYLVDKYNWIIIDGDGTLERNDAFELTIETTAANESFLLPMAGVTEIAVDWGDGTIETGITADNPTHTYATAGTHSISVTGSATRIYFIGYTASQSQLRTVTNLGALGWSGSFTNAFRDCSNMTSFECGDTDTSSINETIDMFRGCSSATTIDVSGFDVSSVTRMEGMFRDCSSVTALDVSGFNTFNVTRMDSMFYGCSSVPTLDVSGFDTSSVTNMSAMFRDCSSVTALDVSGFNTSNVTNMSLMFYACSSVTALDVSGFNTSNVTDISYIFYGCSSVPTLDVSGFDTSSVTSMQFMFGACTVTNLDVSGWNTSNVTNMINTFRNCAFLENLDIDGWNVTSLTTAIDFIRDANLALTTAQYDATLIAWAAQAVQSNVTIHFGDATYTAGGAAETARTTLVNTYGWTITDGGPA